jgi:hypothetical protein
MKNKNTSLSENFYSKQRVRDYDISKLKNNSAPFKASGSFEDKKRIEKLVARLSASKSAKKELEDLFNFGYTISLESSLDCLGYHQYETKSIVLGRQTSDAENIATLAHEVRHMRQCFNKIAAMPKLHEPFTEILVDRATEADAEMTAGIAVWELKEKGDAKPWGKFKKTSHNIAQAIENGFSKGKELNEIKTDAFLSWYKKQSRVDGYTENYVDYLDELKESNTLGKVRLYRQRDAQEIISKVCQNDGECYFTKDAKTIEAPKYSAISKDDYKKLKNFVSFLFKGDKTRIDQTMNNVNVRKKSEKSETKIVMNKLALSKSR